MGVRTIRDGLLELIWKDTGFRDRHDCAGGPALLRYPVREHYIVDEPLTP